MMLEPDIEHEMRLPWDTICKLAVKARCLGMSLNEVCELAIAHAVYPHLPANARKIGPNTYAWQSG